MDNGLLRYDGVDHERAVKRLFRINNDIKLLNEDAMPIPIIDMARKVVPRTLKPLARLKYINMGGPKLRNKMEIIELVHKILEILDAEQEVEKERHQKGNHNDGNHNCGGNQPNL
jgi:hypothetical protein